MNAFERLLTLAADDPDILAVFLGGARGKGMVTAWSDWDCEIIVRDGAARRVEERLTHILSLPGIDGGVSDLTEFRAYAEHGTTDAWDRYSFAHAHLPLDKTQGEVTRITQDKGRLPAASRDSVLRDELDAYINAVYRSAKNARDGLQLSSRLDAAESISPLLTFLFALSGRVRPYNKFLAWELTNHPLIDLPLPRETFLETVEEILTSGEVSTQRRLFALVRDVATSHGLADVLQSWGDDLRLLAEPSAQTQPLDDGG